MDNDLSYCPNCERKFSSSNIQCNYCDVNLVPEPKRKSKIREYDENTIIISPFYTKLFFWTVALWFLLISWFLSESSIFTIIFLLTTVVLIIQKNIRNISKHFVKLIQIFVQRYLIITKNFLPIQKKLFLPVLVSGLIFLVLDIYSWINFLFKHDIPSKYEYLNYYFLFPNPRMFGLFNYSPSMPGRNYHKDIMYDLYSDPVLFVGLIFLILATLLLVSLFISSSVKKHE